MRSFVSSPRTTLQATVVRAVQQFNDTQARASVAAGAAAATPDPTPDGIRQIDDTQKKQLLGFSGEERLAGVDLSGHGAGARFEIWKRTYDEANKKYTQKVTPLNNGTVSSANSSPVDTYYEPRFLVTGLSMPQRERFSIMRTFGADPNFFMTFGQEPRVWNIGGMLPRGAGQAGGSRDWFQRFTEFYNTRLRADLMVQNNEFAVLIVGRLLIEGYVVSFDTNVDSQIDDVSVPFTMSMFVRSARFLEEKLEGDSGLSSLLSDSDGPNGSQWRLNLPQPTVINLPTNLPEQGPFPAVRTAPPPPPPGPPPSPPPPFSTSRTRQ